MASSLAPAATHTIVDTRGGPNILIRILWFLFVGWWLSFFVVTLAAFVNCTIIGIPLGIWLMNRIPQVVTLKMDRAVTTHTVYADGSTATTLANVPQHRFLLRAIWFLLVGWWLATAWLYLAWFLCLLIITIPVAFPMFSLAGKILTLKRG